MEPSISLTESELRTIVNAAISKTIHGDFVEGGCLSEKLVNEFVHEHYTRAHGEMYELLEDRRYHQVRGKAR